MEALVKLPRIPRLFFYAGSYKVIAELVCFKDDLIALDLHVFYKFGSRCGRFIVMVNLHAVFIVCSKGKGHFYLAIRLLFRIVKQEADVKSRDSLGFFGNSFYCHIVFYKLIACDIRNLQFNALFKGTLGVYNGYLRSVVGFFDHLVACNGVSGKGVGGVGDKVAFHFGLYFVGSRIHLFVVFVVISIGLV